MRDWWYEVVKEKYGTGQEKMERVNDLLLEIAKSQTDHSEQLASQKESLRKELESIKAETRELKDSSSQRVQAIANDFVSATRLGDRVFANFQCKKCGQSIGLLIGSNNCPNCNTPIG